MTDTPATQPLSGLRVVEFASYVAGPTGGTTLAQLGAEVIRVDPLGGAPDVGRWPLDAASGRSLFWSGLNRGKRSVQVDVRSDAGRELVLALATAPGTGAGLVIDNQAGRPWLSFDELVARRADVIHVHIQGYADGRAAVDYTVNPEVGLPAMTGSAESAAPVNHTLPAWDLLTGTLAVTALLAALRRRELTGEGSRIDIALADVALASMANMGWITETAQAGHGRERIGNHLYGSYGSDFATADGERVMVVALTSRQWRGLVETTGTAEAIAGIEASLGVDLRREGERYRLRELISALLRPWFAARTVADAARELTAGHVLWSRYRSTADIVADLRDGTASAVLGEIDQPGIGPFFAARSPIRADEEYGPLAAAPRLGQDTETVLGEVLGLGDAQLDRLRDAGTIRGAS